MQNTLKSPRVRDQMRNKSDLIPLFCPSKVLRGSSYFSTRERETSMLICNELKARKSPKGRQNALLLLAEKGSNDKTNITERGVAGTAEIGFHFPELFLDAGVT